MLKHTYPVSIVLKNRARCLAIQSQVSFLTPSSISRTGQVRKPVEFVKIREEQDEDDLGGTAEEYTEETQEGPIITSDLACP